MAAPLIDASLLQQMLIGALLALSVYLPLRCGQLSLATPGFYAIGGTLAALLSTRVPALGGGALLGPGTEPSLGGGGGERAVSWAAWCPLRRGSTRTSPLTTPWRSQSSLLSGPGGGSS